MIYKKIPRFIPGEKVKKVYFSTTSSHFKSVNPDDLTNVNVSKSVNAIEIDWNGYNTGTKVINNTVDFLDWIEEETEKVKPSFSQEADHYQPSAYNGEIIKDNIPISVDGKSTNISVDQYGHFLIDCLPREFGYLYIGDGECTNDSDHLIHNHINRNNFKQLADVYYYPAYIKKKAIVIAKINKPSMAIERNH